MHTCLRHLSHSLDFGPFYSPRDPPQIDFSQPSIALRLHGQPTHASGGENKEDVLAERAAAVDVAIVERHSQQFLGKGGSRRIPPPEKIRTPPSIIFLRTALNVTEQDPL